MLEVILQCKIRKAEFYCVQDAKSVPENDYFEIYFSFAVILAVLQVSFKSF
jgi:hypothetical protein